MLALNDGDIRMPGQDNSRMLNLRVCEAVLAQLPIVRAASATYNAIATMPLDLQHDSRGARIGTLSQLRATLTTAFPNFQVCTLQPCLPRAAPVSACRCVKRVG